MAPELIEERPYDHAADLWSVGCILYELLVGAPPFSTNNLFQLIKKVRYDSIRWPGEETMSPVCSSFLQGLLEKDSRRRLVWPELLRHPFVSEHFERNPPPPQTRFGLTGTLSESQELAKEIQRQDKSKLLPGGSQMLIRVAQRYDEEQKRRLRAMQEIAAEGQWKRRGGRRNSDFALPQSFDPANRRRHSDAALGAAAAAHLSNVQYITPQPPLNPKFSPKKFTAAAKNSIPLIKPQPVRPALDAAVVERADESLKEEDAELENDEWCEFLDGQTEEILQDIGVLNNQNYITMIISPLRNANANSVILEKIATVLTVPLAAEDVSEDVVASIVKGYAAVKVVSHLWLALKRMVVAAAAASDDEAILALLAGLITRLVHTEECFVQEMLHWLERESTAGLRRLFSVGRGVRAEAVAWLNKTVDSDRGAKVAERLFAADGATIIGDALRRSGDPKTQKRFLVLLCLLQKRQPPLVAELLRNSETKSAFLDAAKTQLPPKLNEAVKTLAVSLDVSLS